MNDAGARFRLNGRRLRAEREAQRIFEMSPTLLAVAGFDGYLRRFNPAFAVFGYSREELLARPWIEFAHPEDRERMLQAVASLERGTDVVELENRIICSDGSLRWVQWNTRVVPEEGLFYAAGRDVTEGRRAAAEQAALRRVATMVARETAPEAVFAAVGREVGEVLGVDATHLGRFDADGTVVSVAQWGRYPGVPIGARYSLEGDSVSARVLKTSRSARMDGYSEAPGVIAATVRELGIQHSIGVPVSVAGRIWGVMVATTKGPKPFSAQAESRLEAFTELVATAVSNASAQAEVRTLLDEQAALRRVATLVAEGAPAQELFANVVEEIGNLLGVDAVGLGRNHEDESMSPLAMWAADGDHPPTQRMRTKPGSLMWDIVHTGKPARKEDWSTVESLTATIVRDQMGIRSSVGAPIHAGGRLWGAIVVHSKTPTLPPDTEARLERFAALVVTALENARARAEVQGLADEQAALRRVATLVAHGADAGAVFDAVTAEVAELFNVWASLARYDDDVLTVVAHRGDFVHVGDRYPLGGTNVTSIVLRTGRTARLDDYGEATGRIGEVAQRAGVSTVVAAPVVVEGRTWGVLVAQWRDRRGAPDDAEERLARFAGLLDTAIANADSRDQLAASRARVLAAGDDARRRLVRDLHDGAQQRLVHTTVTLKLALRALSENPSQAEANLMEALSAAERATAELRELAHGILPSVLTRGGLRAGVCALVSRLDLLVDVDVSQERLHPDIEASAYFIIAEGLTNVVKHARATRAAVRATIEDGGLTLEIEDDGVGGADPEGHGLLGIADRVDALGGRLLIESAPSGGTRLTARLPLSAGW
jgi:PAS domain S-box-containing protein